MAKPVLPSGIPQVTKPVVTPVERRANNNWVFSFQYFSQIELFGANGAPSNWFVSLIERLKDLSSIDKDVFLKNVATKDAFRYHAIDWGSKNVPIKRKDLNWINKDILENEEEFPMFQFHISKALGRVVGYWDLGIFYIVLLDRLHNIQPSKLRDYKIRDSHPLSCQYTSILEDIQIAKGKGCENKNCKVSESLNRIPTKDNLSNFFFFHLEEEYSDALKSLLKESRDIVQIIELGILASQEKTSG